MTNQLNRSAIIKATLESQTLARAAITLMEQIPIVRGMAVSPPRTIATATRVMAETAFAIWGEAPDELPHDIVMAWERAKRMAEQSTEEEVVE